MPTPSLKRLVTDAKSKAGLLVLVVALVAIAGWVMLRRDAVPPASSGHMAQVHGTKDQAPSPRAQDPVQRREPASDAVASPVQEEQPSFDIHSIDAPRRPAWESVVEYRRQASPSPRLKAEVFTALSYCTNTRKASEIVRLKQSSGEGTGTEVSALQAVAESHAKYCNRLSDSDVSIRSTLVDEKASQGDIPSALLFYAVGPSGSWLGPESRLSPAEQEAWYTKAVKYLEQAARRGSVDANGALFSHYSVATGPDRSARDPVRAYAYGTVWT